MLVVDFVRLLVLCVADRVFVTLVDVVTLVVVVAFVDVVLKPE